MQVVAHRPGSWFLLESNGDKILDVNCSVSFISYTFAMILHDEVCREFQEVGIEYIDQLAHEINLGAPVLATSKSVYKSRRLDKSRTKLMNFAIEEWMSRTDP